MKKTMSEETQETKPDFQIKFISYEECFNLGNYENRKIRLGFEINNPNALNTVAAKAFYQIHLIHKTQQRLRKIDEDITMQKKALQSANTRIQNTEENLVERKAKAEDLKLRFPDKPHKAQCALDGVEELEEALKDLLSFAPRLERNIEALEVYCQKFAELAIAGEFEKAMELEVVEGIAHPKNLSLYY